MPYLHVCVPLWHEALSSFNKLTRGDNTMSVNRWWWDGNPTEQMWFANKGICSVVKLGTTFVGFTAAEGKVWDALQDSYFLKSTLLKYFLQCKMPEQSLEQSLPFSSRLPPLLLYVTSFIP